MTKKEDLKFFDPRIEVKKVIAEKLQLMTNSEILFKIIN